MAQTSEAAQALVQQFTTQVQQLLQAIAQANPDGRSLHQQFLHLQQTAQQGILQLSLEIPPMPPDAVSAPDAPGDESLVGYQTEISRGLRLLAMDITFLQSARQPLTQQKRQAQMRDRLQRLLSYGHQVLALLAP